MRLTRRTIESVLVSPLHGLMFMSHQTRSENREALVEIFTLTKNYGRLPALEDCSLSVRRGEVFGLLGPNGSGKTTLLRLLMGFLRPSSGRAAIAGAIVGGRALPFTRACRICPVMCGWCAG